MHLTQLNFFKERCNKSKEQYFSRIIPFNVVKPRILKLAIIGFQYTAGSRVKKKISVNVLKNTNSEISKKSCFPLGTLILWIPRSILDLNLLLICGLIYSLFDIPHSNGPWRNDWNEEIMNWSSKQKCPLWILRSNDRDYENPTLKFPA